MDTQRATIIGAGGFIGRNLAKKLIAGGRRPVLVSPSPTLNLPPEADEIVIRVSNFETLSDVVKPGSVIYYLINDMTLSNSAGQPSDFVSTNLTLFVQFLEWVRGVGDCHIVYPSSGGTIYGESAILPTPETVAPNPRSFYGLMKWTAEKYLQLFAAQDALTYTIARIANPYGPDQVLKYGQGLIPEAIERISTGNPISIIGEGDAVRDYIHISDVCDCLTLCGFDGRLQNQVLNVGTGIGHTVIEVIQKIEVLLGQQAVLKSIPKRLGEVHSSVLDIGFAEKAVGWQPKLSFQDGLRTLF